MHMHVMIQKTFSETVIYYATGETNVGPLGDSRPQAIVGMSNNSSLGELSRGHVGERLL